MSIPFVFLRVIEAMYSFLESSAATKYSPETPAKSGLNSLTVFIFCSPKLAAAQRLSVVLACLRESVALSRVQMHFLLLQVFYCIPGILREYPISLFEFSCSFRLPYKNLRMCLIRKVCAIP